MSIFSDDGKCVANKCTWKIYLLPSASFRLTPIAP